MSEAKDAGAGAKSRRTGAAWEIIALRDGAINVGGKFAQLRAVTERLRMEDLGWLVRTRRLLIGADARPSEALALVFIRDPRGEWALEKAAAAANDRAKEGI